MRHPRFGVNVVCNFTCKDCNHVASAFLHPCLAGRNVKAHEVSFSNDPIEIWPLYSSSRSPILCSRLFTREYINLENSIFRHAVQPFADWVGSSPLSPSAQSYFGSIHQIGDVSKSNGIEQANKRASIPTHTHTHTPRRAKHRRSRALLRAHSHKQKCVCQSVRPTKFDPTT